MENKYIINNTKKSNTLKYRIHKTISSLSSKIIFLLLFITCSSVAQDGQPYRRGKYKSRISLGIIKPYFKNHPEHTINTKSLFSYCASYKGELFLGRRTNVILGLEYVNLGLKFQGYYEKPGYTYLYDKSFAYTHELRIQELHVPLSLKVSFISEKEHTYSSYFIGGIGARYVVGSYSIITNDSTGITPYDAKDNIDYENQRVTKGLNAFYQAGVGLQYNKRNSARAIFFEVTYKYGISRYHYDGNNNSNNLNIKAGLLLFSLGFRI
jgi:Outer membrane protein beta-barrel domain